MGKLKNLYSTFSLDPRFRGDDIVNFVIPVPYVIPVPTYLNKEEVGTALVSF